MFHLGAEWQVPQKSERVKEKRKQLHAWFQVLELQAYATMPSLPLFYSFLFIVQTWCLPVVS